MERAQLEQNIRDSKERMEKLEGYWMEAQSLCKVIYERMNIKSKETTISHGQRKYRMFTHYLVKTKTSFHLLTVFVCVCFQAVDEHLKETQAQYQTLERKYSKAKRLIKEYQQK